MSLEALFQVTNFEKKRKKKSNKITVSANLVDFLLARNQSNMWKK